MDSPSEPPCVPDQPSIPARRCSLRRSICCAIPSLRIPRASPLDVRRVATSFEACGASSSDSDGGLRPEKTNNAPSATTPTPMMLTTVLEFIATSSLRHGVYRVVRIAVYGALLQYSLVGRILPLNYGALICRGGRDGTRRGHSAARRLSANSADR